MPQTTTRESHRRSKYLPAIHCGRSSFRSYRPHPLQAGYILIGIIAMMTVALSALLVAAVDPNTLRNNKERRNNHVLAVARQALIGRAVADNNRPGSLPCPDLNNDGILAVGVDIIGNNCTTYIGRLPWRTLGMGDLRDADGERLWYALAPNFRDATGVSINDATAATLSVTGTVSVSNVTAMVFTPGAALNGQSRDTVGNQNNVINYLDGVNALGGPSFAMQAIDTGFNDRSTAITVSDLMTAVERRVANEIAVALNGYFQANSVLPRPALASDSSCAPGGNAALCLPDGSSTTGLLPRNLSPGVGWPGVTFPPWLDSTWRTSLIYTVSPDCTSIPACAGQAFGLTPAVAGSAPKVTLTIGTTTSLTVPYFAQ